MKKIYLHIGCEKTGTTSLQRFLLENGELLDKAGLSYLANNERAYFEGHAHFPIPNYILGGMQDFVSIAKDNRKMELVSELHCDIEELVDRDIVLSSEHFSSRMHGADDIFRLADMLKKYDVTVICYVRRQDEMAVSSYSTGVSCGRRESFGLDEADLHNPYYNYMIFLPRWEAAFGRDKIRVRKFGRSSQRDWDIRADFLDVIGVQAELPPKSVDENVSLDAKQTETLRLINQVLPGFDMNNREAYQRAQVVRGLLIPFVPLGAPLQAMLSRSQSRNIMRRFADVNFQMEQRYMEPGALAAWFEDDDADAGLPEGAPEASARPDAEELARVIGALGEALQQEMESRNGGAGT